MTPTIVDTWDKFERWAYRYKRRCQETLDQFFEDGYSDFDGGLFLCKWHEQNLDLLLDYSLSKPELAARVSEKIQFLQGYLVDISFDGPEFMARHSEFLTLQYPSKCNNSIGVWLEQYLEGNVESGGYFGFQGFEVSFFCKDISDVDLASMRNILPFDRMFIRRPKGQAWDAISANNIVEQVNEDLEFDYHVKLKADKEPFEELFSIEFFWE